MFFSYHYKLPFDIYASTFDMCTNKVYLLSLLTYSEAGDATQWRGVGAPRA